MPVPASTRIVADASGMPLAASVTVPLSVPCATGGGLVGTPGGGANPPQIRARLLIAAVLVVAIVVARAALRDVETAVRTGLHQVAAIAEHARLRREPAPACSRRLGNRSATSSRRCCW